MENRMNLTDEEMELILEHRQNKKHALNNVKSLESYSIEEKCKIFDDLYAMALENYQHVVKHGWSEENTEQWMFEAVMDLLGKEMWISYNEYEN